MSKGAATRTTRATTAKQMVIVALTGLPIEAATVLVVTAIHWGVIR